MIHHRETGGGTTQVPRFEKDGFLPGWLGKVNDATFSIGTHSDTCRPVTRHECYCRDTPGFSLDACLVGISGPLPVLARMLSCSRANSMQPFDEPNLSIVISIGGSLGPPVGASISSD